MIPDSAPTRIMVFGTFDVLHKGHLNFFRQARELATRPYLIVSVARDRNVKKIKGQLPVYKERQRLAELKKCPLVDRVVLGGLNDHLPHILKLRPEIIALGFDQNAYVQNLKQALLAKGLKVAVFRLRPFKRHIYKSSIIKKALK